MTHRPPLSKVDSIVKPLEIKLSTSKYETKDEKIFGTLYFQSVEKNMTSLRALPPSTSRKEQKPLILEHTQAEFIVLA